MATKVLEDNRWTQSARNTTEKKAGQKSNQISMFAKIVQLRSLSSLTAPQNIYKITADDDAHAWPHSEEKENYLPNSQQMPISWNIKKEVAGNDSEAEEAGSI